MADRPAVLSAGTVNADFVLGIDSPLERGASLIARRLLRTSGGRAANVAVMARRLGTPACLFGCVGTDDLAEQALAGPRAARVDVRGVRQVQGDTGIATILVQQRGAKTMVLAAGANDAFSRDDGERVAEDVRRAPAGSVLAVDSELYPDALATALEAALEAGLTTVLDPSRPEQASDRLMALAEHVAPNADEAGQRTGRPVESPGDARIAARRLRERGARCVHVRLPEGGCLTLWPEGEALVRAPEQRNLVDTTGAGDAFVGTLASAIAGGRPLLEAVRLGVAAAACAVIGFGPQESYPDPAALAAQARDVWVEDPMASGP
jgi:ribokinase